MYAYTHAEGERANDCDAFYIYYIKAKRINMICQHAMETVRVKPNEFSVCWAASLMFRALAHVLTRAPCGYVCVCVCVRARACV